MPIYEFQCQNCDTVFEELVSMGSNGEGLQCPQCGAGDIRKKVSSCFGHTRSAASSCQFADMCGAGSDGPGCSHGGGCGCH